MKYYKCLSLRKEGLPSGVLLEIAACHPPFSEGSGFRHEMRLECQPGDQQAAQTIERILRILEANNIPQSRAWAPASYYLDVNRHYEQHDLENLAFVSLTFQKTKKIQHEHERDSQGRLLLIASNAKPSLKIGTIWPNRIILSDELRKVLESGTFTGLQFGEVALKGKSIHASPKPFWELKSSIVLPKLANTHQFFHPGPNGIEPFTGDYSKMIAIADPPYRNGELYYRHSDLERVGGFDVGQTFELFSVEQHTLVVSHRFYQFCLQNKIPLDVQPVRIDPD